jgi:hypothetical protein
MARVQWFLSRAAAGIVLATMTAAAYGLFVFLWSIVPLPLRIYSGADPVSGLIFAVWTLVLIGTAPGTLPGVLLMCVSRASVAPWRSIPILLAGTSVGGLILSFPLWLRPGTNENSVIMGALYVAGFAIGGLIASRFIPEDRQAAFTA